MGTNGTLLQHFESKLEISSKNKWIGIYYFRDLIYALTSSSVGIVIDTTLESEQDGCVTQFNIGQDKLFCFRLHESGLIATGGEERDLHLWDIHSLTATPTILYKAKNVFFYYLNEIQ